jgi:integrase
MFNPAKSVELEPGTHVREYAPNVVEFQHVLQVALDKKNEFEEYIPRLLIARWETGLRIGEIIRWKWEEIDLEYTPQGDLPYFTTFIEKQKRITKKQLPMSYPLWKMLKEIPGQHETGFVFRMPNGEPLKHSPFKSFRRLKKLAGISWELHDLRKSRKTALKRAGFSKELTKAFQGHATDSMDDYYTVFGRNDLEPLVKDSWKDFDGKMVAAN